MPFSNNYKRSEHKAEILKKRKASGGKTRQKRHFWTAQETTFLKDNYQELTNAEIGLMLNIAEITIFNKLRTLRLSGSKSAMLLQEKNQRVPATRAWKKIKDEKRIAETIEEFKRKRAV